MRRPRWNTAFVLRLHASFLCFSVPLRCATDFRHGALICAPLLKASWVHHASGRQQGPSLRPVLQQLKSRTTLLLPYFMSMQVRLIVLLKASRSYQKLTLRPEPHVGHLYSMVIADALKRWQLIQGRNALLCTGTDEHGMKVQRAAHRVNIDPKSFCDRGAQVFLDLAELAGIAHDYFIRTTDQAHVQAVQHAWNVLNQQGYIYLSKHEGWYSVSDETYYPQAAVHLIVDPPTGRKIMASIETGKEVEWTSETNYCFRLSAFRDRLMEHYKAHPNFVVPRSRMREIEDAVSSGLQDLSVSRPSARLDWGIPVPGDSSQTIYVWLDALVNYVTTTGYPWPPDRAQDGGWPADVHVIGKDITRFHCIYWPAFLMALDVPLPKQILAHAHWTLGREKMSKSTGNVVNPFFAIERFGNEVMRYFFSHSGGLAQDADYDNSYIIERYKTDLQGGLGNLTSRVTRGKGWSIAEAVQGADEMRFEDELTKMHHKRLLHARKNVADRFDKLDIKGAMKEITTLIYDVSQSRRT